ncbi:MAG: hypothetical protein IJH91_07585 [Mogibacterium sp.]|nr:hypothetical protein [Mogibacterium sp.]
MKLFGFKSKDRDGGQKKTSERAGGNEELLRVLKDGSYYEAAAAAEKLVSLKDYSGMNLMITRMNNDRMAVPLSRIPDEAVVLPLILAISEYAILNLNVSTGSERFSARSAADIFRNLLWNVPDKAIAYIAEIADYHFFFMKDGELLYTVGQKAFGAHLDRPDLIASAARDALAKVPEEQRRASLDREKPNYRKVDNRVTKQEIRNLLYQK